MLAFRLQKHYANCFRFYKEHILASSGFDPQLRLEINRQSQGLMESLSSAVNELRQVALLYTPVSDL